MRLPKHAACQTVTTNNTTTQSDLTSELNTKMYGHYEILSRSIFPCHVQTSLRPSNSDSSCRFLGRTLQDGSTSAGGTTEEARTIERPTSYIASSDVELKAGLPIALSCHSVKSLSPLATPFRTAVES